MPGTGSGYAVTISDAKQRQMGCALNEGAIEVEELVRLPIQWTAGMRTTVCIGIHGLATPYHEDVFQSLSRLQCKSPRPGISQIIQTTQTLR